MIFARFAVLAVIAAVAHVNAAPFEGQQTDDIQQMFMELKGENLKMLNEMKKIPGVIDAMNSKCSPAQECRDPVKKVLSPLFKSGYEPWGIPIIEPTKMSDFNLVLLSSKFSFENVELNGFDTIFPDRSTKFVGVVAKLKEPLTEKFSFDLTVKGKLRQILTVSDKEYTYETDFVTTYNDIKAVIKTACAERSWRLQECNKKYEIEHTFEGKPVTTLSDQNKDGVYKEWERQNEDAIKAQREELRNMFVKSVVDAFKSVQLKFQEHLETVVDSDKMDRLWDSLKKFSNI